MSATTVILFISNIFLLINYLSCNNTEDVWKRISSAEDIFGSWEEKPYSWVEESTGFEYISESRIRSYSKDVDNNLIIEVLTDYDQWLDNMILYYKTVNIFNHEYSTKDELWYEYIKAKQHYGGEFGNYYYKAISVDPYGTDCEFGYWLFAYAKYYINQNGNKLKIVFYSDKKRINYYKTDEVIYTRK
jgi:hypothetical protein